MTKRLHLIKQPSNWILKNHLSRNNLGLVYLKKEDRIKAAQCFQEALEINPKYAEAYNNLGATYMADKEVGKAIPQFLKAIELKPDMKRAYINVSVAYRDTNDFEKALDYAYQAKTLGAKNADYLIERIEKRRKSVQSPSKKGEN